MLVELFFSTGILIVKTNPTNCSDGSQKKKCQASNTVDWNRDLEIKVELIGEINARELHHYGT